MRRKTLALALLLLPAAASAGGLRAFVESQLRGLDLERLTFELQAPPAAPLFDEAAWAKLPVPDAAALSALKAKVPGLNTAQVRTMTWKVFEPMLARAAAGKMTVLDLFTDDGLTKARLYHMPRSLLEQVEKAYELNSVLVISGTTNDGQPFKMTDAVLGGGLSVMVYDRDDFTFAHPIYTRHGGKYTLASRVYETILGPGKVAVSGLTGFLGLTVQEIHRVDATSIEVVTPLATVDSFLYPIAKK